MEITYARQAVQRAEDARLVTLRQQAAERQLNAKTPTRCEGRGKQSQLQAQQSELEAERARQPRPRPMLNVLVPRPPQPKPQARAAEANKSARMPMLSAKNCVTS